ncbi:MAG: 2-oxoacid:acceptor oxidoreductase [Rhodospirillaceae bacterium]|jgi:2-oxoglutarate ferredoxin oxidoreductase subunit alpha|nr:2-oxoacid:acceptor oxidoreductase [Rhodospirillaceae bacterium]
MTVARQTATDIQIAICGAAGDGTIAAGDILKRAMAKAGYKVIAFDIYPPEIRGFGKCIARVRFTSEQVYSLKPQSDVLISLNDSHAISHVGEVGDFGAIIYEATPIATVADGAHISSHLLPSHLPYGVAFRNISERTTGSVRSRNFAAVGYLAGLYSMPRPVFHQTIAEKFKTKAAAVTTDNITAFDAGFEAGAATFKLDFNSITAPPKKGKGADLVMMSGNGAVAKGCLEAGIDAFFGYPITPATSIMERLAVELPKRGARLLQTEDEISAIAATIGAGYAGSRAATATSGPGFALMTEMMGLAAIAEVPAVIFVSQRGGPSTGMPTKTEQSDLNLAVFGAAGDAQRIVLAPTNVEGCWKCAGRAFEMAEKYQTPVVVLLDLYLSNRYEAVTLPVTNPFTADCRKTAGKRDKAMPYRRYQITSDGVSPCAVPGDEGLQHTITGLEHDESGRPSDHPDVHQKMSQKRHDKFKSAVKYPGIKITKRFGDKGKVEVGVLGWGSTFGEILEAMIHARKKGIRCAAMKVVMLSPLPVAPIASFFAACDEILVPELNYEGQFANLVSSALGRPVNRLNRVPGTPMHVDDIIGEIRRLAVKGHHRQPAAAE